MSQSNYEKYAVVKQQELLHKERNLQQAISCLKDRKKFVSLQSIDSAIDFVADLYDLSIDEVKRAMDGEEYWCVWNRISKIDWRKIMWNYIGYHYLFRIQKIVSFEFLQCQVGVQILEKLWRQLTEVGIIIEYCLHGLIYLMKVEINLRYFMNDIMMTRDLCQYGHIDDFCLQNIVKCR